MITLTDKYIRSKIIPREICAHKGDFGKVLIFAGSPGMAGAAILCAKAALRSGAGLVRFLIPEAEGPLLTILQCSVPEATCVKYDEDMDLSEYDAIAAGPGIGQGTAASYILRDILTRYAGFLVLDADALNLISSSEELHGLVQESQAKIIMTPHPGEARRLLSGDPEADETDWADPDSRLKAFSRLSERYYSVIVLKGSGTLVGTNENTFINTTGNPGMATGGSGDVLTGIIASLGAQGYTPLDAACVGVYVHGLAGDMAAESYGQMGMISSDIADQTALAFRKVYPSFLSPRI